MRALGSTLTVSLTLALALGCGPSAPDPILGVRLGMTPAQVRDRFGTAAGGTFRGEAQGEDFALVWAPPEASRSPVRAARHEFHVGQLVAMRLTLDPAAPAAQGPPVELTELSVLTRERVGSDVALTWLARACPTHAEEVRRRIQEHR
ncbi:MAG: hypothetical protein KF729_32800 [Sandaracinaceae bacterium]|nr:hypothetical protein [Sandaracinaceae bacterium]